MLSAGEAINQPQQNQQAQILAPQYNRQDPNIFNNSAANVNLTGDLKDEEVQEYMKYQWGLQLGGMAGSATIGILNSIYSGLATKYQYELGMESFNVWQTIAGYQREVEIQKLALAERGQDLQREMHEKQVEHEEKMAELNSDTQLRLKQIDVEGQNKRAEMLTAVIPAFSRDGYFGGSPFSIV